MRSSSPFRHLPEGIILPIFIHLIILNKFIFTITFSKLHPILLAILAGTTLFFIACNKDNDPNDNKSQLNLEITDGPTEDPNVKAVFITVAEAKVDGQTFSGFSGKKTIDLLAYQQGNVAALGLGDIDAGTYQNITLVLDAQTDASGTAQGCYVQTFDNVKHPLSSIATHEITAAQTFVVGSGAKTNLVLDFDLRKAVQYQVGGNSDHYDFVGSADLQTALRLVIKNETGSLNGTCQNGIVNADKVVAYMYKKGTFNRAIEIQSNNGVSFKNAVASTALGSTGEFKVAFLKSGDYEIHFAAYKDLNSDDKLDFLGTLILNSTVDLNDLRLAASTNLQLNVTVIGILP